MIDKNDIIQNTINVRQQNWLKILWDYIIDHRTRESIRVCTFMRLQFTKERQEVLNKVIEENGFDKITDYDQRMITILKWVRKNLVYSSDSIQYKTSEKWAYVDDILKQWYVWKDNTKKELILVHYGYEKPNITGCFRTDDCEGGALLIWALAVQSGIPRDRLYLFVGDVVGGGHAWVGYISEKYPYVFFFLDWCYWYDPTLIAKRKAFLIDNENKQDLIGDKNYKRLWFFTNDVTTYRGRK